MILGMTDDGEYIEAASGDPEVRFRDLLRVCPDIRLDLLERGKLISDSKERKRAILKARLEILEKEIRRLKEKAN